MQLPYHDRYPYSPIVDRPNYSWPDGKRLAVYLGLNIEHFAFGAGEGHLLTVAGTPPDARTFAAAAQNFEELVGDVFPGGTGRLKLVINPAPMGSPTLVMTMGMVVVAALAAFAASVPKPAISTSGLA